MKKTWRGFRKLNKQKVFWLILGVATLAAMMTALLIGLRQSVWFDEAYSIIVAKRSVGEILSLSSLDTHPPLYYLLLKAWAGLWSWSELSLRLMSIIFYGGTIFTAGIFVRKWFGTGAGIYAVILMAVAPMMMRYGFEIRMYAMAAFIGILATAVLVEARLNRRKWCWIIYAILVAAGMLTLYYLAFLWLAHALWLAWLTIKFDHKKPWFDWRKWRWLTAYVLSFVLFLPWLPSFLSQLKNDALAPIGREMNLEQMMGIVSYNTVYQPLWKLGIMISLLVLACIFLVATRWPKAIKNIKHQEVLWLVIAYMAVPIMMLILVSFNKPMYVERYLSHVAVGLVMLAAIIIFAAVPREKWQRLACLLLLPATMLVGLANLASYGNYNFQRLQKPNVNKVAENIHCSTDNVVLAADPYVAIEIDYYLSNCQLFFFSPYQNLSGGYAPLNNSPYQVKDLSQTFTKARKITYVSYGDDRIDLTNYQETAEQKLDPITVRTFEKN